MTGSDVIFGQNVVLRHPHKIHIGSNVVIDDNCLLDAKGEELKVAYINEALCKGCGACAVACPTGAACRSMKSARRPCT